MEKVEEGGEGIPKKVTIRRRIIRVILVCDDEMHARTETCCSAGAEVGYLDGCCVVVATGGVAGCSGGGCGEDGCDAAG